MNYEKNLVYSESTLEEFSNSLEPAKDVQLFYAPLTIVVNQLLDNVMRDFVLSWWTPINEHKDPTFEKLARERLNIVFLNVEKILLNQDRNDIVMSTVYGVANTLIIHMRECRALEDSELSIDRYVLQNPQSPFSQLLSKEEQHRQLRTLSQTFLKRTLPSQDRDSLLLMSLFKELLANFVFGSMLDSLSDPDFLNCWIIELLSEKKNKTTEAIASAVLADAEEEEEEKVAYPVEATPPNTPELTQRANTEIKPSMIFPPGSVHFTIMDISAPQESELSPNKTELVYIIQIERPAMEDHAGSEGGGYVITRSYADFETFNSILYARHSKRATKLQLRLPLDAPKSWLKPSSQQKKRFPLEAVGQSLERYIDAVVRDGELGTDPIILPFLRKERRSEVGNDGTVIPFAQEFKEEAETNGRSRSLFSRNSISSLKLDDERSSSDQWFTSKTRTGSISSIHSGLSKPDSPTDEHESPKQSSEPEEMEATTKPPSRQNTPIANKALSAMDVELLIETTYALIVEIFNLTSTNNKAWMRRSILNLLREIVRRTYAEFISEQYSDFVNEYMSPDAIVSMLNKLGDQFWPEGKWMLDGKEQVNRTEEDKEKSKQLARSLLMSQVIPNAVRQLIGDQNCNTAMDRIWARCQNTELNRVLILQVIERIIKPILG
ncbi:hypothetical protein MFLAVUS_007735 [Mucor flavus]|uniref:PXA domain-containing protein n=1 Tax=Mucor flavus TaxID=439312 RepID=A0ABP9Z547_9FUNG